MINISSTLADKTIVKRFVKECPERFSDAIETATNKAAARIRYLVKREVSNKWGVSKDEMKNFKLRRALRSQGETTAMAVLSGRNVPLFRIGGVTPNAPMGGKTTGGVSVMLAGRTRTFKGAFISEMESGHVGVFKRTGVYNYPEKGRYANSKARREMLEEVTTTSVAGMAASEKTGIPDKIAPMIQEEFENVFIKEAETWLNVMGAK